MSVQDSRHNTDHYLVIGCLCGAAPSYHSHYIGKWKQFLMKLPNIPGGVDRLFAELRGGIPKLPQWERPYHVFILMKTWQIIDTRIAALRSLIFFKAILSFFLYAW